MRGKTIVKTISKTIGKTVPTRNWISWSWQVLALCALSTAAVAQMSVRPQIEKSYFEISHMEMRELRQPSRFLPPEDLCVSLPSIKPRVLKPAFEGLDLGDIVNTGMKIWEFIKENQPKVNVRIQDADAIPVGITSWLDLECWQLPQSKSYRVTFKNLWGMSVVDFIFKVHYTYGGRINGRGRYLSQVTVTPGLLNVLWGYTVNANVTIANVVNVGTKAFPIAGIQLDVNWSVSTPLKYSQSTETFFIRGDGEFRQIH